MVKETRTGSTSRHEYIWVEKRVQAIYWVSLMESENMIDLFSWLRKIRFGLSMPIMCALNSQRKSIAERKLTRFNWKLLSTEIILKRYSNYTGNSTSRLWDPNEKKLRNNREYYRQKIFYIQRPNVCRKNWKTRVLDHHIEGGKITLSNGSHNGQTMLTTFIAKSNNFQITLFFIFELRPTSSWI